MKMSKAPDKIYIDYEADESGVYMSLTAPHEEAIEYIRKDALVEWIDKGLATRPIIGSSVIAAATKTLLFVRKHINEM